MIFGMQAKRVDFRGVVGHREAEDFLDVLQTETLRDGNFQLDFSDVSGFSLGACARIVNALVHYKKWIAAITVPRTWEGIVGASVRASNPDRLLLEYSIGTLSRRELTLLPIHEDGCVWVPNLHLGTVLVDSVRDFMPDFLRWIPLVSGKESIDSESLLEIGNLCFESIQNVLDHASKQPNSAPDLVISSIAIRRIEPQSLSAVTGPVDGYRRLVCERLGSDLAFLSIQINDNGPGLPGRDALSYDIYKEPLGNEDVALSRALSGSSVKPRARDAQIRGGASGIGYPKIISALRNLNAFASLRTGRSLVTFSTFGAITDKFRISHLSGPGKSLALMPGAILEILVPIKAKP